MTFYVEIQSNLSLFLTFRFQERGFITNLFLILCEVLEGARLVPGFLDHHVLVQEELAVLVVVSRFLKRIFLGLDQVLNKYFLISGKTKVS